MRINDTHIIVDGDMSGNITSAAQPLDFIVIYSVQLVWAGTLPVGTVTLEASNDGTTWTTVADSSTAISGNTGSGIIEYSLAGHKNVRVKYTRTSGVGTLNCWIYIKG